MENKQNQIVSIFSGIGVLDLGFAENFDVVLSVEIDQGACAMLEANKAQFHPHMTIWNRDIYTVTAEEMKAYRGVAGLIGGPQCQAFSPAKQFDPNDPRISGLTEYLRWLKELQPEFFVFENTFGLLQGKKKALFDYFKETAESLGYLVQADVLNAHDHGSPQDRKRIIAVGVKRTAGWQFSFPAPLPLPQRKYVRDILREEPIGDCMMYSASRTAIIKHVPEGGHWRQLPTEELKILALGEKNYYTPQGGMTGAYRRLHRDKPCPTLVTVPTQRNTMLTHPTEDRPLSVNEYKRAMGLPDEFLLKGSVSSKYKAIGNAVPRELSAAICQAIVAARSASQRQAKEPEPPAQGRWEQLELPFA